jgi:2-polyprenyl-6-methoxyphenol hydroxylase-like FAD-dependent oxidoreductase
VTVRQGTSAGVDKFDLVVGADGVNSIVRQATDEVFPAFQAIKEDYSRGTQSGAFGEHASHTRRHSRCLGATKTRQ